MFFFLWTSNRPRLHLWIDTNIKENGGSTDSYVLFLKDVTPFKWDKFYVLSRSSDKEKILRLKYHGDKAAISYVFLKNGRIVYHEDHTSSSSDSDSKQVGPYFHINDKDHFEYRYNYMSFTPDEAVFHTNIAIWDNENGLFFHKLYPVEQPREVSYRYLYPHIESYFEKNCEDKDSCVLSLKDIMFFEWDELYIMSFLANRSEILGFKYYVSDNYNSTSYVFLKEKGVVFSDNHYNYPDSYGWLICSTSGNPEHLNDYIYMIFTPEEAVFHVKQIKPSEKPYYLIYPIAVPSVVVLK
jgi:hypothetical protein